MDIKIAVAYHKKSPILKHPYLIPIHAGKAISDIDLGIQGDDEGENISFKNPWYCEMTVMYWLWKNTQAEYKGLMHYRRVFTIKKTLVLYRILLYLKFKLRRICSIWSPYSSVGIKKQYKCKSDDKFQKSAELFASNLDNLLKNGTNIIVPYPGKFYMSIRRTLCWHVGHQNLELMDKIVKEMYPEFFPFYDKAMNGLKFYNANMFVMDNNTFDNYCTMIFNILERHEKEVCKSHILIDITKEKAFSRVSGYLAEMLTNAYIQYCIAKKMKVKIVPVAFLSQKQ
ncbi:MAG: DUF4422 domain-containing protein [Bacteroidaceae bacterium]|jgi:hypothetical protein|nr:DUF4422 domain-containing protein [Bacteroidaceae bacterium]